VRKRPKNTGLPNCAGIFENAESNLPRISARRVWIRDAKNKPEPGKGAGCCVTGRLTTRKGVYNTEIARLAIRLRLITVPDNFGSASPGHMEDPSAGTLEVLASMEFGEHETGCDRSSVLDEDPFFLAIEPAKYLPGGRRR